MPKARITSPDSYRRLATLSDELTRLLDEHQRTLMEIHRVVSEMRASGASWAVIGALIGISPQGAQKRFRGKQPVTWRPPRRNDSVA